MKNIKPKWHIPRKSETLRNTRIKRWIKNHRINLNHFLSAYLSDCVSDHMSDSLITWMHFNNKCFKTDDSARGLTTNIMKSYNPEIFRNVSIKAEKNGFNVVLVGDNFKNSWEKYGMLISWLE